MKLSSCLQTTLYHLSEVERLRGLVESSVMVTLILSTPFCLQSQCQLLPYHWGQSVGLQTTTQGYDARDCGDPAQCSLPDVPYAEASGRISFFRDFRYVCE